MMEKTEIKKPITLRSVIRKTIKEFQNNILNYQEAIRALSEQNMLLCDDEQWFTEQIEKIKDVAKNGELVDKLIGRVNWEEKFECFGTTTVIHRSKIVRIDGEWVV